MKTFVFYNEETQDEEHIDAEDYQQATDKYLKTIGVIVFEASF